MVKKTNDSPEKPRLLCMERGPGPAKYCIQGTCGVANHNPTKHTKPAYTFGTKSKAESGNNRSPGPVYFVPPNLTRMGLSGTPSYSMTARRQIPFAPNTPSPNAYRTEYVPPLKTSRPPSYSFGLRTRYFKTPANPAPNAYSLPRMMGDSVIGKKSAATFTMTGRSIIGSFHQDLRKTPGPGAYNIGEVSVIKNRQPVYSLRGRVYPPSSKGNVPGPGTYRPETATHVTHERRPAHSFGIKHSEYLASFELTAY